MVSNRASFGVELNRERATRAETRIVISQDIVATREGHFVGREIPGSLFSRDSASADGKRWASLGHNKAHYQARPCNVSWSVSQPRRS